jgi:hypothetical protein
MLDSVQTKVENFADVGLNAAPDFMKPRRGLSTSK